MRMSPASSWHHNPKKPYTLCNLHGAAHVSRHGNIIVMRAIGSVPAGMLSGWHGYRALGRSIMLLQTEMVCSFYWSGRSAPTARPSVCGIDDSRNCLRLSCKKTVFGSTECLISAMYSAYEDHDQCFQLDYCTGSNHVTNLLQPLRNCAQRFSWQPMGTQRRLLMIDTRV